MSFLRHYTAGVLDDEFAGTLPLSVSKGFNPILILPANQNITLAIQSIAGNAVPSNPTGALATPDVLIPAGTVNPVPVVVSYANIPLNTPITVIGQPVNGASVIATTPSDASGTVTFSLSLPRGGGTIYARAVVPVATGLASLDKDKKTTRSYAETGLTTEGERFAKMEITATPGRKQEIAYITESGKRFSFPGK